MSDLSSRNERAFREHDKWLMSGPPEWELPDPPKFDDSDSVQLPDGRIGSIIEIGGSDLVGYTYHIEVEDMIGEPPNHELQWFLEPELKKPEIS
jgi:hypothetical protein